MKHKKMGVELRKQKQAKRDAKIAHRLKCIFGLYVDAIVNDPFSWVKYEAELLNMGTNIMRLDKTKKLPTSIKRFKWMRIEVTRREMDHLLQKNGVMCLPNSAFHSVKHMLETKITRGLYNKYRSDIQNTLDTTWCYSEM